MVQEIDDRTENVIREFSVKLGRSKKSDNVKNEENIRLVERTSFESDDSNQTEGEEQKPENKPSFWRAIVENASERYDDEMGSTFTPTSIRSERDHEAHTTMLHRRMTSPDAPPIPDKVAIHTTSFQRHARYTPYVEDDDDDLYNKPLAETIIENVPLEYLEREIQRRRELTTSSTPVTPTISSVSQSDFLGSHDKSSTSRDCESFITASAGNDSNPPPLPPREPIHDSSSYVPKFSVNRPAPSTTDSHIRPTARDWRRNSVQSTASSILSSTFSEVSSIDLISTSWHQVGRATNSSGSSHSSDTHSTDFERYLAQTHDAVSQLNYGSVGHHQDLSHSLSRTSTLSNFAPSEVPSEPSLIWSPNPSFVTERSSDSNESQGKPLHGSTISTDSGIGSFRSSTPTSSHNSAMLFDEFSEMDEAVTPCLSPVSTLDRESIIYQLDPALDDESSSSNASHRTPVRQFH